MAKRKARTVWLVMQGEYDSTVESVHASEASGKAWIAAAIIRSLKDELKTDLILANNAAERRGARYLHRTRVAAAKAGDMGSYDLWRKPVLELGATS